MEKIKIELSKYQKALNYLSLFMMVAALVYFAFLWSKMPEQIPAHYGLNGEVDRFGSKIELVFMPIAMLFIYILISVISKFPSIWNTGVEITPANQKTVYHNLMNLIISVKFILVCIFSYIMIMQGYGKGLGSWFAPISLIAIFAPLIYFIVKIVKISHSEK